MTVLQPVFLTAAVCSLLTLGAAQLSVAATVLCNGKIVQVEHVLADPGDLWVNPADLTRITGFTLKDPGVVCLDDACISLTQKGDGALLRTQGDQRWVNLTGLAHKLKQAYAVDHDTGTWSFGPSPTSRTPFLKSAIAPNFELPDRNGKIIRLSDYRGKKVLLLTWASWCGCRLDVPKWEPLYQKLKGQGFEIISVAEDTGGEAAAGPTFDKAHVTFVTIIDPDHTVSTLFNFVNVPSAAWIDENGKIVRINEGTYATRHAIGLFAFGTNEYAPAVEDWVKNGAKSKQIWSTEEVAKRIRRQTPEEEKAEALFTLGVYFYKQHDKQKANRLWDEAETLYPESWNIHRQDWAITEAAAQNRNWMRKVSGLKKPYYAPLDLKK